MKSSASWKIRRSEEAFSQPSPAEAAGLDDVISISVEFGRYLLKRGDSDSKSKHARKALELFISIGDAVGAARSYNNMGYILRRGDKNKALEAYSEVENILSSDDHWN